MCRFAVVQMLPTVAVIVVDELLLYQRLMHNFVLMEDRKTHYLFLNRGQGNQKGLDLLFAMVFQCAYDQRLGWRRMYMDSSKTDGMILGFASMEVDLLLIDLAVNNPRTTMMPDSLQKYEYFDNGRNGWIGGWPVILPFPSPVRLRVGFMFVMICLELGSCCCRNWPLCWDRLGTKTTVKSDLVERLREFKVDTLLTVHHRFNEDL